MRKPVFGFPTRSDTNRAVLSQKMARGLKFRIYEVEGLYFLCSENKAADQLLGYREANLRLYFRICKNPVFSSRDSLGLITRIISSIGTWGNVFSAAITIQPFIENDHL